MKEQFDPTNFLTTVSAEPLQDANTPKAHKTAVGIYEIPASADQTIIPEHGGSRQQSQIVLNPAEKATVNSATDIDQKPQQGSLTDVKKPDTHFALQLWRTEIAAPPGRDSEIENELRQIIEQIRSVEFDTENQTPQPVIVIEPTPETEPDGDLSITSTPVKPVEEPQKIAVKSEQSELTDRSPDENRGVQSPSSQFDNEPKAANELPYGPITVETLKMLEGLSPELDQLSNPLELGDVLFLSGNLKDAAVVYQQAIGREDAENADSARDRTWILLQTGNCLRNDNLEMAAKVYKQLITEHPDSPWTELAKAQDKLIDWFQKENLKELMEEN